MYYGIGGSAGYGVGRAVVISDELPVYEKTKPADAAAEVERFQSAVDVFTEKTMQMADRMRLSAGQKNAEILEGHVVMISDPFMQDEIKEKIMQGMCAEQAVDEVCAQFIEMFNMTEDELTMQRATDIRDIRIRLLRILTGTQEKDIREVPAGTVIVAKDLTPSMTAGIVKENVAGIITETGGVTSHSAILARALEIPGVFSVEGIISKVKDGMEIALDGSDGIVILEPDEAQAEEYRKKRDEFLEARAGLEKYRGKETRTADGILKVLFGNIGKPDDAAKVIENDGEGIGLFRTEFLFMNSKELPTEEEQFEAYKKTAEIMRDREVIIRTLDIGGDKDIPYLGLEKEDNPFLGYRAIRFCLNREDIYKTQLRAILRASAFGKVSIMVPLVTCVKEVRDVKALVEKIKTELDSEGVSYDKNIKVGIMVETPAASEIADLLAKEADFFSIGTNDLTQYTMAVDRGNSKVAYLYSVFNPAVLRSLKRIIGAARQENIMVGMCGEAAADQLLTPVLISFGLEEFSVSAGSVLATRAAICKWSKADADAVTNKVMECATKEEVIEILKANRR